MGTIKNWMNNEKLTENDKKLLSRLYNGEFSKWDYDEIEKLASMAQTQECWDILIDEANVMRDLCYLNCME